MSKFIEIHANGSECLLNVDFIDRVTRANSGEAIIYTINPAFSYLTDETYEEIRSMIMEE